MSDSAKQLTEAAVGAVIALGSWRFPDPPGGGDQGEVILAGVAEVLAELRTSLDAIADVMDDTRLVRPSAGHDAAEIASMIGIAAGQAQAAARSFRQRHPLFYPPGER